MAESSAMSVRRRKSRLAAFGLSLAVLAAPAAAQACGGAEWEAGRADARSALLEALAGAETEPRGRAAEAALWQLWTEAPTAEAQLLIDLIFDRRRRQDLADAEAAARALVELCPAYAEGWNQLATVLFGLGQYEASLDAIAKTLAREPAHFGALAGKASILMRQGQFALGQAALREAVAIDPWLHGREMLSAQ